MEFTLEDYIYEDKAKEQQTDFERFHSLLELGQDGNEESANELLMITRRLFYNHYGQDVILNSRQQLLDFFDVEINDDHIPATMNSGNTEHDELIEEVLNALDDVDDLKKLNPKKLASRYPELPFLTLVKIIQMELEEAPAKKIKNQLEEALSIYPNDILLQLEKDVQLSRNGQDGKLINLNVLKQTVSKLFQGRTILHSFELMSLHTTLFENFIQKKEVLLLDALIYASYTLYPEWEDLWEEKELYGELMKVEMVKMFKSWGVKGVE